MGTSRIAALMLAAGVAAAGPGGASAQGAAPTQGPALTQAPASTEKSVSTPGSVPTQGPAATQAAAATRGAAPTPEAVNGAEFAVKQRRAKGFDPVLLRAQVLLDRAGVSPGSIDGRGGENVRKAIAAFERLNGLPENGRLDPETWARLTQDSRPVLIDYTLTDEDLRGPFLETIPDGFEEKAKLKQLGFTSPAELLAEKFHMDEELLTALNPGRDFKVAGTPILVAAVSSKERRSARVKRIEVDKKRRTLRAFDGAGAMIAFYPASIGSDEKPAPSGSTTVRVVAPNPAYYYNPDYKFRGVETKEKLTIQPGPNNPVGSTWIDLDIESYGIHGTPEPDKVSKSYSHGCVRLTNWDAAELAGLVEKGTVVDFVE